MSNQLFFNPIEILKIHLVESGITYVDDKFDTSLRILPYTVLTSIIQKTGEVAGSSRLEFPNGRTLAYSPGTTILIPRNTCHRFSNTILPHTSVWIHWDVSLMTDMDLFHFCEIPDKITGEASIRIANLCGKIHQCGNQDLISAVRQQALLYELLGYILQTCSFRKEYYSFCAKYTTYLPLLTYIDKKLAQKIQLQEIAKFQGYSISKLQQEFSEIFGISIGNFITRRRLLRAARLLHRSPLSLAEIAEQVGYADAFCLSKAFKKSFGISPKDYKRLQKKTFLD